MRLDCALSIFLSALMAVPAFGAELKVSVLEGQNGTNNITTKASAPIAVQVADEAGKPVKGAEVVFQAPGSGPGGTFRDVLTYTARTNESGRAATSGFVPNDQTGSFKVAITATAKDAKGTAEVAQSNVQEKARVSDVSGKSNWKKYALGLAAVGAVIGIVAATRGN